MAEQEVEVLVEGGKANAGPPLGITLGPMGVNVKAIVDEINKETADLAGMEVPVKVKVKEDKSFTIEVGKPPTSALIKKELDLEKGCGESGNFRVGDLTEEQVKKVSRAKFGTDDEEHCNQVKGTARSMGITVGEGEVTEEEKKKYEEAMKAKKEAEAEIALGVAEGEEKPLAEEGATPAEKPGEEEKTKEEKPSEKKPPKEKEEKQ